MAQRAQPPVLLVAIVVTLRLSPGCAWDEGDRYLNPDEAFAPGGGGGGDGSASGGHEEGEVQPEECAPGEVFCHEGARWRCDADGTSATVVQDCTSAPHDACVTGPCRTGDDPEGACCVASEPLCHAAVEVEGKRRVDVEYSGLWDDDFACSGSVRDDGFNWSLWARVAACEGRYVRLIASGYRDGWTAGASYPLCRTMESDPAVHVTLMADSTTYTNLDEGCGSVTGNVTFHDFGLAPGEPFHLTIDGTLLDATTGETREVRAESTGLLLRFE